MKRFLLASLFSLALYSNAFARELNFTVAMTKAENRQGSALCASEMPSFNIQAKIKNGKNRKARVIINGNEYIAKRLSSRITALRIIQDGHNYRLRFNKKSPEIFNFKLHEVAKAKKGDAKCYFGHIGQSA